MPAIAKLCRLLQVGPPVVRARAGCCARACRGFGRLGHSHGLRTHARPALAGSLWSVGASKRDTPRPISAQARAPLSVRVLAQTHMRMQARCAHSELVRADA